MERTDQKLTVFSVLGIVLVVAGIAALVAGYIGLREEVHVALQLPYLMTGGLGGLFLLGLGVAALLGVEMLRMRARFDVMEHQIQDLREGLIYISNLLETAVVEEPVDPTTEIPEQPLVTQ